jgi:hypothetical protein
MANEKLRPPRSSTERLAELPQFKPDHTIPYHHIDFDNGNHTIFSPERTDKIKSALVNFISVYVRSVNWEGKLTGIDRFVNNAMRAIAQYERRKSNMAKFDRQYAKDTLRATVDKILDASRALERIAANNELAHFLEQIFVTLMKDFHRETARKLTARALTASLRRSERWRKNYQEFAPHMMAARLMRLEQVLTAAAERVELRPGDFQRDEIAQELCNELAFAWISGTGQLPTFSESNSRLRNKSPFAELLSLINDSILDPRYRQESSFRTYGVKARDLMRKKFPGLVVSHEPRRRA